MFMMYIDLAELPHLFDGTPGWSARRRALAWFKRSDYLQPHSLPLDRAVRDLVAERTGARPEGPIRLLTHLRYFGYCMNPVSFYYCFDTAGESLQTIVAEITNTPWGERHQYVLRADAPPADAAPRDLKRFDFAKDFHVSPFMPMQMRYLWCFNRPSHRLFVNMRNFSAGAPVFTATLNLREEAVTPAALLRTLASFPFMTLKVEDFGPHYALTLKAWRERFLARRAEVRALGYPERFVRMWEFYLCYCEGGFEERQLGVVQMLLTRPRSRRAAIATVHAPTSRP
jgi:hypothetical protein